jgi:mitogen-activated protein kinase organizer 1
MLNTFGGPDNPTPSGATFENTSYRSKVAFGYGERSVLAGDEKGGLWVWDIVSVSSRGLFSSSFSLGSLRLNVPRKAHEKVITWIEHHPTRADEMLTASAGEWSRLQLTVDEDKR